MMAVRAGRYAAIDIGTVTCRMLVADVDASGLHELDREYVITNLGEGVNASGVLKPQAMERVAQAVDGFQCVLARFRTAEHPSIETVAMATSAARDARNAEEFAVLLAAHGETLAVIPGQREAALSFRGASSDFAGEGLLVVDVGGGSAEVVAGRAGADPFMSHSFDIGCRRMTERFFSADPPTDRELAQARAWVRADMEPFFAAVRTAGFVPGRLVAVAGTATSVVSIHERMEVYDAARVHKTVVSRAVLDEVCALSLIHIFPPSRVSSRASRTPRPARCSTSRTRPSSTTRTGPSSLWGSPSSSRASPTRTKCPSLLWRYRWTRARPGQRSSWAKPILCGG